MVGLLRECDNYNGDIRFPAGNCGSNIEMDYKGDNIIVTKRPLIPAMTSVALNPNKNSTPIRVEVPSLFPYARAVDKRSKCVFCGRPILNRRKNAKYCLIHSDMGSSNKKSNYYIYKSLKSNTTQEVPGE